MTSEEPALIPRTREKGLSMTFRPVFQQADRDDEIQEGITGFGFVSREGLRIGPRNATAEELRDAVGLGGALVVQPNRPRCAPQLRRHTSNFPMLLYPLASRFTVTAVTPRCDSHHHAGSGFIGWGGSRIAAPPSSASTQGACGRTQLKRVVFHSAPRPLHGILLISRYIHRLTSF